ncbi:hypothetical protein ACQ4LE_005853 [Meloidogyne hapla]
MFRIVYCTIMACPCPLNKVIFEDRISLDVTVTFNENMPEPETDLLSCLDRHFQTWTSKQSCERCPKAEVPASMHIWRLPQILVIQLGRGKSDGTKNCRFVDFPLEGLDMSKYVHPESTEKDNIYSLYAIVEPPIDGALTAKAENLKIGLGRPLTTKKRQT